MGARAEARLHPASPSVSEGLPATPLWTLPSQRSSKSPRVVLGEGPERPQPLLELPEASASTPSLLPAPLDTDKPPGSQVQLHTQALQVEKWAESDPCTGTNTQVPPLSPPGHRWANPAQGPVQSPLL